MWEITDYGLSVLNNPSSNFNVAYLKTYPSFAEFYKSTKVNSENSDIYEKELQPYESLVERFNLI